MPKYESIALERGLPAAPTAESMLIGACMLETEVIFTIDGLDPSDFATPFNRVIFSAIMELHRNGRGIDRVSVAEHLQKTGQLDAAGGIGYLVDIDANGLSGTGMASEWARTIQDRAAERRGILACHAAIRHALERGNGASGLFAELSRITEGIEKAISRHEEIPCAADIVESATVDRVFGCVAHDVIKTPWEGLNGIIGGLERGQMVAIGGRPSTGKTVLLAQMAEFAAGDGRNVLFFSLEMNALSILQRLVAMRAGLDLHQVRNGNMDKEMRGRAQAALGELCSEENLQIGDKQHTIPAMRSALAKAASRRRIDLVAIDYLQLISGSNGRSRVEQITEISRSLKLLAQQHDCALLVASQLSRESEKESREPRLSDLRDSGSIEQDSDVVIFPYRRPGQLADADLVNSEIIVAKQRNGRLGRFRATFERPYVRYV